MFCLSFVFGKQQEVLTKKRPNIKHKHKKRVMKPVMIPFFMFYVICFMFSPISERTQISRGLCHDNNTMICMLRSRYRHQSDRHISRTSESTGRTIFSNRSSIGLLCVPTNNKKRHSASQTTVTNQSELVHLCVVVGTRRHSRDLLQIRRLNRRVGGSILDLTDLTNQDWKFGTGPDRSQHHQVSILTFIAAQSSKQNRRVGMLSRKRN
jgi:hypothetical protein